MNKVTFSLNSATGSGNLASEMSADLPPVGVAVKLSILKVIDQDDIFEASVLLHAHFTDESSIIKGSADKFIAADISSITFLPSIHATNQADTNEFKLQARVNRHTGVWIITYHMISSFREAYELDDFPYDQQLFRVSLNSTNASLFPWNMDKKELYFKKLVQNQYSEDIDASNSPIFIAKMETQAWFFENFKVDHYPQSSLIPGYSFEHPEIEVTVLGLRKSEHYFANFVEIILFIGFANVFTAAIPIEQVAERLAYASTLLLSLVAYKFVFITDVPNTGTQTTLDTLALRAFQLSMVTLTEISIWGGFLSQKEPFTGESREFGTFFNGEEYEFYIFGRGLDSKELFDVLFHVGLFLLWGSYGGFLTLKYKANWVYRKSFEDVRARQSDYSDNEIMKGTCVVYKNEDGKTEREVYKDPVDNIQLSF